MQGPRVEMARDDSVFVFGLGVDDAKGMYGTTSALHDEFGAARNFDTPLSEDAMTGVAIGAALAACGPSMFIKEWTSSIWLYEPADKHRRQNVLHASPVLVRFPSWCGR